jgi:hypothetical protein
MHNFLVGYLVMENPSNDAYLLGCNTVMSPVQVLAKLGSKILCADVWGLLSKKGLTRICFLGQPSH